MARLVECEPPRRASTGGDHTRRAVRAHDRNLLRPGAARAYRPQGHAVSAATRPECAGVQRRDRVPFAALAMQRAIFGALTPIAHWRGYRATYPQLSRIVLAPRP